MRRCGSWRPGIIPPQSRPSGEPAAGAGTALDVTYWRERNHEVDFVLQRGTECVAIEVKSGRRRESLPGMAAFAKHFSPKKTLLVGAQGIPLEEFLGQPAAYWLD